MNNTSFHSYINSIYARYKVSPNDNFFKRILIVLTVMVLDTLSDAFIELLLVVLFLLGALRIDQGKDLIVSLFEPEGFYGYWRLGYTTATIILFSISMW